MKALLDTHVCLWWLSTPEKLSDEATQVIRNPTNMLYVSAASLWEMAIKASLGRLQIPSSLTGVLEEESVSTLAIEGEHALSVSSLPLIHSDPFDRMLIAQALAEDLTLITRDADILRYKVRTIVA